MSHDQDPPSQADLERRRVPLERKVSLKFKEFRGFITEVSHNISLGGMFIGTTSPKPPGTIFDFELSLTDDFKLVQGIGEVVWTRDADEGAGRPAGMGVRFLDLSPESRRLIQRIVEEHVSHGGVPFDLEPAPFPPPPLRTAPQRPPLGPALPVFHPTAAPMAPPPPAPGRATRGAEPAAPLAPATPAAPSTPSAPAPPTAEAGAREVSPDAPTAHLPRAAMPPMPPRPPAPEPLELPVGLPDLEPPELPMPELLPSLEEGLDEPAAPEAPSFPSPPRPAPRVSDGFAEVARAFAPATSAPEPPQPAGPPLPEADDTVRLARFAPPAAAAAPAASSRWERPAPGPPPPAEPPRAAAPPSPAAVPGSRRPAPRRSRRPLAAALVILLAAGGAAAALYLRFPELLPAWAPGAPAQAGATGEERPRFVHPRRATPEELAARGAPGTAPPDAGAAGPPAAPALPAAGAPGSAATAPAPADEPPAARFTAVEEIWGQRNAAGTMVTLVTDGSVPQGSFTHAHLDGGKPREVVYLRGVAEKFPRPAVAVGTPEVAQVRTGYHVKPGGNELHVVVDLASPDVRLIRAVAIDNRIELLFGR